jgi:hypothetical protein
MPRRKLMIQKLSRFASLTILTPVLSMSAEPVFAADPLVPCKEGYVYRCYFEIMCGCVLEKPIRSRRTEKKPLFTLEPDATFELTAVLPHDVSPSCEVNFTTSIYDAAGELLLTEEADLSASQQSLVIEATFDQGQSTSKTLRKVLKLDLGANFDGCTTEEALDFGVIVGSYETQTGKTLTQQELLLPFEPIVEPGVLPPVYPAYLFPPGLFKNRATD